MLGKQCIDFSRYRDVTSGSGSPGIKACTIESLEVRTLLCGIIEFVVPSKARLCSLNGVLDNWKGSLNQSFLHSRMRSSTLWNQFSISQ